MQMDLQIKAMRVHQRETERLRRHWLDAEIAEHHGHIAERAAALNLAADEAQRVADLLREKALTYVA